MVVCVEPEKGLFFRINTEGKWQVPVFIDRVRHTFLDHDSYIESGDPIELDDYIVDQSLRKRGVLGRIDVDVAQQVVEGMLTAKWLTEDDKTSISKALLS